MSKRLLTYGSVGTDGRIKKVNQRAAELFVESIEVKGVGWLAPIVFNGIVNDVKPWHSGYNIEFTPAFTTKHREHE